MVTVKVSVIVPVYNTQNYLHKCLSSICNQTLKDIEIIIINDGSTDDSEREIMDFMSMDDRIIYIKHDNIGLGPTRNVGVKVAKGQYLSFIDSDDYIEESMLETMYFKAIEKSADVICCETILVTQSTKKVRASFTQEKIIELNSDNRANFFKKYYYTNQYSHNACDKLFNRSFVNEKFIEFGNNEEIFAEDTYFQMQILVHDIRIVFLPSSLYNYVIREGSIMTTYKSNLIERNVNLLTYLFKLFNDMGLDDSLLVIESLNVIVSELSNVISNRKGEESFVISMNKLRNSIIFEKLLPKEVFYKGINLEANKGRMVLHRNAFWLYRKRLNFLGDKLYFIVYFLKNKMKA